MPNYLNQYDATSLPTFSECVVFNGTKVFFTPVGIRRYKERFARAGFDIAQIVDADDLQRSLEGSFHVELQCLAELRDEQREQRTGDPIEWALRDALFAGDRSVAARLKRKLRHRGRAELRAISGGSGT